MSTALAEVSAPTVTSEQLDLIKRTVAKDATADELKLHLYNCHRHGVHPLDGLLHFTKRGGKYTPVTSIDLMRIRAAETGEYAGSDDAEFGEDTNQPTRVLDWATVTVWRLVQGQRCAFTATARWSEYFPGESSGHMWKKMPHTMLAKCAEALALRKGFPRQLAGLYAREEMDQAGDSHGYVVEAPAPPKEPVILPVETRANSSAPNEGELGHLESGAVLITKVEKGWGNSKAHGFLWHSGQPPGSDSLPIYQEKLFALASELCQQGEAVILETKESASGKLYVKAIQRALPPRQAAEPMTASDIPF